ncbi:MAG TPA: trypsin-like peptidase domain-containing protein [Stellaceae bacterium]|nr:trypsin-like peptidase domain-containing protein [Stellaceae bacterium]
MLAAALREWYRVTSAACALGLAMTAIGCTQADLPYAEGGAGAAVPSFAPVVQRVMPAVVNVAAVQRIARAAADGAKPEADRAAHGHAMNGLPSAAIDEFFRRFFGARPRGGIAPTVTSVALGSGFIIDPSGYVVTDDHVIEDADKVSIAFQDAVEYPARIVGRDPLTDIALLKVEAAQPLSYVQWGDSDAARIGDWVLAIGSPFGLENTVSSGIISGRGRDLHAGPYDDFLQIDAAMNRGNSGGPTFDLRGNVIGVNTAIYSPNGGSVGIGFAIPANRARPIVEQLRAHGRVARGWLGVQIQAVSPAVAYNLGLSRVVGAFVEKVGPGSPAAAPGFERGDVILSVNGREVRRLHDLPFVIAEMPIGQTAAVTIWRRNAALSLRPVIGEMPANPSVAERGEGGRDNRRSEQGGNAVVPASAGPAI